MSRWGTLSLYAVVWQNYWVYDLVRCFLCFGTLLSPSGKVKRSGRAFSGDLAGDLSQESSSSRGHPVGGGGPGGCGEAAKRLMGSTTASTAWASGVSRKPLVRE